MVKVSEAPVIWSRFPGLPSPGDNFIYEKKLSLLTESKLSLLLHSTKNWFLKMINGIETSGRGLQNVKAC